MGHLTIVKQDVKIRSWRSKNEPLSIKSNSNLIITMMIIILIIVIKMMMMMITLLLYQKEVAEGRSPLY